MRDQRKPITREIAILKALRRFAESGVTPSTNALWLVIPWISKAGLRLHLARLLAEELVVRHDAARGHAWSYVPGSLE